MTPISLPPAESFVIREWCPPPTQSIMTNTSTFRIGNLRRTPRAVRSSLLVTGLLGGCGDGEETSKLGHVGDACLVGAADQCAPELACEPRVDRDEGVCAKTLALAGSLRDALSNVAIERGLVFILDETGTPVAQARTGADGSYQVTVSAPRTAEGELPKAATWTLAASAQGYQPFPFGARTPVPVSADQLKQGDTLTLQDENTSVVLIPLEDASSLASIDGRTGSEAVGGIVVAENVEMKMAPYGLVGPDGDFTIFNVPKGDVSLRVYRRGLSAEPKTVTVTGEMADVALNLNTDNLSRVSGSVNIVNAPGGSLTSVVLVPKSVFDEVSEKGPVPFGLRVPDSPGAPNVGGSFAFNDVAPGIYVVLAAFENDGLVRDPDSSIGGTRLQTVEVVGSDVTLDESFKVTAALAVEGPGKNGPEEVAAPLVFQWQDDSSEDRYHFVLRSALGEVVWEQPEVPAVNGSATVNLAYDGPELEPGMFYQFQVVSMRDSKSGATAISRTEDLRGAFRAK